MSCVSVAPPFLKAFGEQSWESVADIFQALGLMRGERQERSKKDDSNPPPWPQSRKDLEVMDSGHLGRLLSAALVSQRFDRIAWCHGGVFVWHGILTWKVVIRDTLFRVGE